MWSGLLAYEERRWGEALSCLAEAARLAEELGGHGPVIVEGKRLLPLLKLACERGAAPEVIVRALAHWDAPAADKVRVKTAPARMEPPLLPALHVRLLGGFSGQFGHMSLERALPSRGRGRELLAYLLIRPEGRRRDEISTDLWPAAAPGQDVTLTHTTLHRLRQTLAPELIVGDGNAGGEYRINPAIHLELDVLTFDALLREAQTTGQTPAQRRGKLAAATAVYQGEFFPRV